MATVRWTGGANDGNWGTAGNWSGGAVPVANDDVIIDTGSQNITAFPARIPATAGVLTTLKITPGWTGSLGGGAAGVPTLHCTTSNISLGGSVAYFGPGVRTTMNIDDTGRGTVFITDGTNQNVIVGKGRVDIGASAAIDNGSGSTSGVLKIAAGATVSVGYNSSAIASVVNAGTLTCARPVTTCANLGLWIATDTTTATYATTATIYPGSRWNHRAKGNLATVTLYPNARLDAQGAVYDFTVGSTAFEHWVGSILDRTGTSVTITVSNETTVGARSVA